MTRTSTLLLALAIGQASLLFGDMVVAQDTDLNYRLPGEAAPWKYELELEPDLTNFRFVGEVSISLTVHQNATNRLTLNAKNLNISQNDVTLNLLKDGKVDPATVPLNSVRLDKKLEFLIVETKDQQLHAKEDYLLKVKFNGELNDQKRGFYRSRYFYEKDKVKYVAATHFEPTGARLAFPCWDEPGYKAIFQISLKHASMYTAISNMPQINSSTVGQDTKKTIFKETQKMSTYLVAFVVSDYQSAEKGIVKVWTKPEAVNKTQYALEMGETLLSKLSEYTKINYTTYMPKMDQVTLKDFAPSAMENWGLVTYRESVLINEPGVTTTRAKQSTATIIAHEFAHQWFGNLVSPKWWTYVWLNEGFADYFEYFITHQVKPEWRLDEVFVVNNIQGNAFIADAADDVRPMNKEVNSPEEISNLFDSIAYQKAGSVIRMMAHILTESVFQKGLNKYLDTNKLNNADSTDLLKALHDTAGKSLVNNVTFQQLMDEWVNKPGYPVVNVIRDNDGNFEVSQERFLLHGRDNETKWWVPLTYTDQVDVKFNETIPVSWLSPKGEKIKIDSKQKDAWVIFNIQQTGYYRVNYDNENWKQLTEYLKSSDYKKVHVVNRAQLVDDALSLARGNKLNYTVALSLSLYLTKETDYIPWLTAFRNLNFLNTMLRTSKHYETFKLYVRYLMKQLTDDVGYEPKANETEVTKLLQTNAMKWACKADVKKCTDYAKEQFNEWLKDSKKTLDVDLRNNILCTGVRLGDESTWNETSHMVQDASRQDEEKTSLLPVLSCSESPEMVKKYMLGSLLDEALVPFETAVSNVVAEHPDGVDIVLDLLISESEKILKLKRAEEVLKACVEVVGGAITNQDQFAKLTMFMLTKKLKQEAFQNSLTKAMRNLEWLQLNQYTVEHWLVTNEPIFNSAGSLVYASFLLVISIFITRFY